MITHSIKRLHYLLISAMLITACDDPASLESNSDSTDLNRSQTNGHSSAPALYGPDFAVMTSGSSQSLEYSAKHSNQEPIDVEVLQYPDGANVTIADDGGDHRKKITLEWNPGSAAEGGLHLVSIVAREYARGSRSAS